MRRVAAAGFAAWLLFGAAASAHRVDEYLQATLLAVEPGRIQASMQLVAGESVARSVIAAIDDDRDGVLSAAEQRAYAQRVLGDLSITVDGRAVNPKLLSWTFLPPAAMRQGLGPIRLVYEVELPPGDGERTFTLTNRHRDDQSVYLVNVLAPTSDVIRIGAQKRDARQSSYELRFGTAISPAPSP